MIKMRKILAILLVFAMIFSLAACANNNESKNNEKQNETNVESNDKKDEEKKNDESEAQNTPTQYPVKYEDYMGNEVVIDKEPEKIATVLPAVVEMIYSIGAENKLVGISKYCNYPEEALTKEDIGDAYGLNIEKLIDLGVDLYICDSIGDDVRKSLEDAGVKVALLSSYTFQTVFDNIALLGNILNCRDKANELVSSLETNRDYILNAIKDAAKDKKIKVFYEVWNDPLMTAGPGSFMDEMITMLGGENIAGDTESAYPEYSVETLIEKNPEVYVSADDGSKSISDIKMRDGYDQIDAVKNGRIYLLDPDIISRPGPRIVDALSMFAQTMYPEIFEGK